MSATCTTFSTARDPPVSHSRAYVSARARVCVCVRASYIRTNAVYGCIRATPIYLYIHIYERISGSREGRRERVRDCSAGEESGLDGYFTFEGLVSP